MTRPSAFILGLLFAGTAGTAHAQDSTAAEPSTPAPPAPATRETGLPKKIRWTFNFDAGLGTFGFANSLYTDVRPDPSGDLSENWVESYAKPSLKALIPLPKGEFYGGASVVGERTFAAPPPLVGPEASSFQVEDLYAGWRSGKALALGEDALDFTVGRTPYRIGQGFILWDGAGEGGSRGGFWSNARKAWQFAGIARFKPTHHALEGFYLDRDEVPEARTGTRLWGANYELAPGGANTFGLTYLGFWSDSLPDRDGMSVVNARAYLAPFKGLRDLTFGGEYALEENGDRLRSTAWMAQTAYQLSRVAWKPKLSYRYAFFQGDDPSTSRNEGFDSLLPGFYDWGTWWQGEIAGEYFLANSNLISHQARVHFAPNESLGWGLIGYAFQLDQPASFGENVTAKSLATELDAYADWKFNGNFTLSAIAAYGHPQAAATQAFNRTSNFTYGMLYVGYSY
jgi:hypothetical protein